MMNRLRQRTTCAAFVAVSTLAPPTFAEEQEQNGVLGADAALIVPVGDWAKGGANVGFGALVYADHQLVGDLALTLRGGYAYHLPKSGLPGNPSFREALVLAGGKYRFGGPYVAVDAGLVWVTLHLEPHTIHGHFVSRDFEESTVTEGAVGVTGGVGYEIGDFDFRTQVLFPALGQHSEWLAIMVTAGYRFFRF